MGGDYVNTSAPAYTTFNVSYNVRDAAGNAAIPIFRTVIIADAVPPVLYVLGVLLVYSRGNTFSELKKGDNYVV